MRVAVFINQYTHIAEMLIERAREVLDAPLWVADERGIIVASSDTRAMGLNIETITRTRSDVCARVPLPMGSRQGEVVVGSPANDEALSPRLARVLVELIIQQTLIVSQLPNRQELKNKFIHDLLRGRVWDETATLREGQILGLDLTHPRAVILIDATDYIVGSEDSRVSEPGEATDARVQRRAQHVIASIVSFFDLRNDTICAYIGDGEVAVLKASSTRDLVKWADALDGANDGCASWADLTALKRAATALLGRLCHDMRASVTVGIGRYHPGIRGLALSYQDARAALSLGRRFHGQNQVHCLDGLGVASFVGVSDERTKIDLAMHLLSPLDHEDELLDTLDAFFAENCSVSATSARLSIHRNTLSYRLDKIASLTGLDPRTFDDAVQIRLALLLREL